MPKVLLVEDDEALAALMSDVLVEMGLEVRHTDRRAQALRLAATWRPDLVVTDLLTTGDTGDAWAYVASLRAAADRAAVLVVTGYVSAPDEGRARGVAVLPKPFDLDEFEAAVLALLPLAGGSGEDQSATLHEGQVT